MSRTWYWLGLLAASPAILAFSCAPAYRHYPTCHVDCSYCPPPPLPWQAYDDCECHAPAVQHYLQPDPDPTSDDR